MAGLSSSAAGVARSVCRFLAHHQNMWRSMGFVLISGLPARNGSDHRHWHGDYRKLVELQRFDFVSFDANRQRSLNRIDRDDQRAISASGEQNTFDAVQRPAADSNLLADFQEGVERPRESLCDECTDRLDLFVGNWSSFPANAHDSEYAINLRQPQPISAGGGQLDENVTTKQWQFHPFPSVAPAMYFAYQRKKSRQASFAEPVSNNLLVSSSRLYCIPLGIRFRDRSRSGGEPGLTGGQSFALWVTSTGWPNCRHRFLRVGQGGREIRSLEAHIDHTQITGIGKRRQEEHRLGETCLRSKRSCITHWEGLWAQGRISRFGEKTASPKCFPRSVSTEILPP
jgi:hypothetical protein